MKHRHCTNIYESPDCNADMTELKVCVIMSLISHTVINVTFVIIFHIYCQEIQWKCLLGIQIMVCVFYPFIEFLLSPFVRFKITEIIDSLRGDDVPSNEVIVT